MGSTRRLPVFVFALLLVVGGLSTVQSATFGQDYDAVKKRLLESVENDELTFEQAAAMMKALKSVGKDLGKFNRDDRVRDPRQPRPDDRQPEAARGIDRIKQAVENGRITEEEAKQRIADMRKRMQPEGWGDRGRAQGDRSQNRDGERRAGNAEKDILRMIEKGQLTKEQGRAQIKGIREREEASRAAEQRRDIQRRERERNVEAKERIESARKKLREMVETGKMSDEEAEARLKELQQRIRRAEDGGRDRAPRRSVEDRAQPNQGQSDRAPRGGQSDRRRDNPKAAETPNSIGERMGRRAPRNTDRPFETYRKVQSELLEKVEAGKMSRDEAKEKLEALKRRLWADSDSSSDDRREKAKESDRRRRGDGGSDQLSDREIETIKKEIEKAINQGVREASDSGGN